MDQANSPFFVTTPIYYVNGEPHLGHAYTSIAADVLARWKRRMGHRVFFLTGTDEHGQKVEQSAIKAGLAPQEYVDGVSRKFSAMGKELNISNDFFIRTTDAAHKSLCQMVWTELEESDFIYLGVYEGWYSTRDECYYGLNEVVQHQDGRATTIETQADVVWIEEPSFFFRLSIFRTAIRQHILANPEFLVPVRSRNEILALLDSMEDICVSRTSFSWGIPVPNHDGHVMYVWIDALMNYITALAINDKMEFWPADVHLIGKEITRFHALIWPGILMALGHPLPKKIFAHGWWTANGKKMSKSDGNVVDPHDVIQEYGVDRFRYFVLREMPFGNDGDFSKANLTRRANADLSNDLGNLAQRTLTIVAKRLSLAETVLSSDNTINDDLKLLDASANLEKAVDKALNQAAFHEALDAVWKVIRDANAYISIQQPWKTDNPDRSGVVLKILTTVLRDVANVLSAFMPDSMDRLIAQLDDPTNLRPIFPRL
jgi:methionyl-tRNA synthetase